jgi:hypothetical protein
VAHTQTHKGALNKNRDNNKKRARRRDAVEIDARTRFIPCPDGVREVEKKEVERRRRKT